MSAIRRILATFTLRRALVAVAIVVSFLAGVAAQYVASASDRVQIDLQEIGYNAYRVSYSSLSGEGVVALGRACVLYARIERADGTYRLTAYDERTGRLTDVVVTPANSAGLCFGGYGAYA